MKKVLIVTGKFGERPRTSRIGQTLSEGFEKNAFVVTAVDGGTQEDLDLLMDVVEYYDIILWLPNIEGGHDKCIKNLRVLNPDAVVILPYRLGDLETLSEYKAVAWIYQNQANMGIVFQKVGNQNKLILIDPTPWNNSYAKAELDNAKDLTRTLINRIKSQDRVLTGAGK